MATIAYVGNFRPDHSTENDVRRTLAGMGHRVSWIQEDEPAAWDALLELLRGGLPGALPIDLILWTSTYDYSQKVGHEVQREMLYRAREAGVPTMAIHLDRWWGLDRWRRVLTEPMFSADYVLTADGAHQHEFAMAGVNHLWSPPAIAPHNCVRGTPRREFACDVMFVGNWQGGYHSEWTHRPQLIKHLRRKWGRSLRLLPDGRNPSVRGQDLADAYASAKVIVGDSCLVPKVDGSPMTHYVSDRVFETIGRGGLLVHPRVHGVTGMAVNTLDEAKLEQGHHLLTWELGNWDQLDFTINDALRHPDMIEEIRQQGFDHVRRSHTYANRLDWALGLVGP